MKVNDKPYISWEDVKRDLKITPEQEEEIKLEEAIIEATIEAREKSNLTQRELSKISGIRQPVIARIEKGVNSPQTNTLMKLLYAMGYTLKVVPLKKDKK
jgi:predicted XRE-type DNA-binding protein